MTLTRRDVMRLAGVTGLAVGPLRRALGAEPGAESAPIRRAIPGSGELLPAIGLGTSKVFDVGTSPADRVPLREVLRGLVVLGGSVVDTSPMYGRSEEVIGALAAELALLPKLFLATKVWTKGREAGVRQMEASMKKLGAEKVDLMQVHNLLDVEEHLPTLREWKKAGRIRYVGVTHWNEGGYEYVEKILRAEPLDFLQINYSAGERGAEKTILPLAKEKGIAVLANRPFGGGGLLHTLSARPLPAFAAELGCTTWAQLLLKFAISHPAITCAIPGTDKVSHLRENMAAGRGRLPDEAMRRKIAQAAA